MDKCYFEGAEITKVYADRFYIIGYKDKEATKKFIAEKYNLKNFKCTWIEVEEVRESRSWEYQQLKIN